MSIVNHELQDKDIGVEVGGDEYGEIVYITIKNRTNMTEEEGCPETQIIQMTNAQALEVIRGILKIVPIKKIEYGF